MADRPSVADYIQVLKTTVPNMVKQIGDLAKAELKPAAKHGGIGVGAFAAAAVVGLTALFLLMMGVAFALSMFYHEIAHRHELTALMLGFFTMTVICLLIVAGVGFFGWRQVRRVKAPEATIAETKASIAAITDAISSGAQDAKNKTTPAEAVAITSAAKAIKPADDGWAS